MNIGIVCYPSIGGSGVVATELGKSLAERGHAVHFLSSEPPFRLGTDQPGVLFHRVHAPGYPVFQEPQYLLALTNRIVQVSRQFDLDVIHAHYAIPHAAAAYLAARILAASGARVPKVITTLHGTDITIVGSDPSYSETVAFCIDRSDGVTAVSGSLKADTRTALHVDRDIRVIPNFLDCGVHRRVPVADLRARLTEHGRFRNLVTHVSNFRPVKRPVQVVEIFALFAEDASARLLLVGDGPELGAALRCAEERHLADRVTALGEQENIVAVLSASDLFLLPSSQESFGLAALEAMACGVPVVASRVGGLPEFIDHGTNGFLHPPAQIAAMAESARALLGDTTLRQRVIAAGRETVEERFCADRIVPQYEAFYREVLDAP